MKYSDPDAVALILYYYENTGAFTIYRNLKRFKELHCENSLQKIELLAQNGELPKLKPELFQKMSPRCGEFLLESIEAGHITLQPDVRDMKNWKKAYKEAYNI